MLIEPPTPLIGTADQGGAFFNPAPGGVAGAGKPRPMSISEQLDRLAQQGMAIPDREQAAHCLRHIGYHRLRGYWHPFAIPRGAGDYVFREGTTFPEVIARYDFDRRLRALLADALGVIEVSVRAQWVHYLSNDPNGGPRAHLNPALFDHSEYTRNLAELKQNYLRIVPPDVAHWDTAPIWEVADTMSFGNLSKWYRSISARHLRNAIAGHYQTSHKVLVPLLYNMTLIRNTCAHHGRLWNLTFSAGFRMPRAWAAYGNPSQRARLYNRLVIIAGLMDIISPARRWPRRLLALLDEYPRVATARMGFPERWRRLSCWPSGAA